MILVDANVLLRLIHVGHPHQTLAIESMRKLHEAGGLLVTCPQALREFYVVCTRPAEGGFALAPEDALAHLDRIAQQIPTDPDPADTLNRWRTLVR